MSLTRSDILDSRDVEDRYDELAEQAELSGDEKDEFVELSRFMRRAEKTIDDGEWRCGITLIHENHFIKYVKENYPDWNHARWGNLPDIIKKNIDWEGVAEQLRSDYTCFEFDDVTFYYI